MRSFYLKQKVLSVRGRFFVLNEREQEVYQIEGSFLKIPKTYTIRDMEQNERAVITKKVFSFLPTFFVEVEGNTVFTIKKQFTFLKAKYSVVGEGIEVSGNIWGMNFDIVENGRIIGRVVKKWLTWGDTYHIQVLDEKWEMVIISLVVAIDCVKADQSAAASAASN